MKYQFSVTLEGFLGIEASSEAEAKEMVEDGFSINDVDVQDVETDFLGEIELPHKEVK